MSKIQFESKSQREQPVQLPTNACKQLCQRYNLKANHNYLSDISKIKLPVSNYVKDTI